MDSKKSAKKDAKPEKPASGKSAKSKTDSKGKKASNDKLATSAKITDRTNSDEAPKEPQVAPKKANSVSDNDSVIEESEVEDFTGTIRYMKGAPIPTQLKDLVRDKLMLLGDTTILNDDGRVITNLTAMKTGY